MDSDNPATRLKAMLVIHWAVTLVPVLFGAVVKYTNMINPPSDAYPENIVLLIAPVVLLFISVPVSSMVYKNFLNKNATPTDTLTDKLSYYQTGHLIRLAIIEVAGLVACVVCLITGNDLNMIVLLGAFIFMARLAPSTFKMAEDINLTPEEHELLR